MKKRYAFMDVVRLVSMLGIVYYHMVVSLYLTGIRQYESVSPLFENNNIHIAKIAVGLFFMISGAGLMISTKDKELKLKDYYLKRFFRILVPFYVVYVLYLISFMLLTGEKLSGIYSKDASPFSFIFTLLGMDAYVSSFGIPTYSLGIGEWFLGALVIMYIIFPILRWALLKNKWLTLGLMSIYYIITIVTYQYRPYASTVPGFVSFDCKVYEFFLGMFVVMIVDCISQKISLAISAPIIALVILCPVKLKIDDNLLVLLVNIAFFMFFMGLENVFSRIPRAMKLITFLCGYTYEFFLVHHVIIDYMTLQHIGVPFGNSQIPILFIQEFIIITVVTVLVRLILGISKLILAKRSIRN